MTWINAGLLLGTVLAGLPVLLHLLLKARPKVVEFPALLLLQARRTVNSRRMKIRHFLLLLLRSLLILCAVLMLARPSLPAANYGLRWWEWLTAVAVAAGAAVGYQFFLRRTRRQMPAGHVLRERRSRLRLHAVTGGLLAALLFVGVPWGLRVRGELSSPRPEAAIDVPVAAVFVFDTSLSMSYRHENLTRLEAATAIASEHLSSLPAGSRVAVVSTSPDSEVIFQADRGGAQSRMEALVSSALNRPLNTVLRDALEAQIEDRRQVRAEVGLGPDSGDAFSREIVVFSDQRATAWQMPDDVGLRDRFAEESEVLLFLADVGVANPVNISLTELRVSHESAIAGRDVSVSVTVSPTAASENTAVAEAWTLLPDGTEVRAGVPEVVEFRSGPAVARFSVPVNPSGSFQEGVIRLGSSDPLSFDDVCFFTIGVRPKPRILIIGDTPADTWFVSQALAPDEAVRLGVAPYDCSVISTSAFNPTDASDYDIICALNCSSPDAAFWSALLRYAENGGSVLLSLGGRETIRDGAWRTSAASALLPGIPLLPRTFRPVAAAIVPAETTHPVADFFNEGEEESVLLSQGRVQQCWALEVSQEARTILRFQGRDDMPALLERAVGNGRCMMFTSALDYDPNRNRPWNNLPANAGGFIMLLDQVMQYLNGMADQKRNYSVGSIVEIRLPADMKPEAYLVARPRFRQTRGSLAPEDDSIIIDDADEAGHYRVRADEGSGRAAGFISPFAVNNPDSESDLTAAATADLDEILGENRYSRVTDVVELSEAVTIGRVGVEIFPVLLGLLVVLFCAEHLMANFFYDEEPLQTPAASTDHAAASTT